MDNSNKNMPLVKLKGVGDSFWITLDPTLSLEYIEKELTKLFERLKHLAINARIVIDTGVPDKYDDLIENLSKFLKEKFCVGMVTSPPKKKSESEERNRQQDVGRAWQNRSSDVLMLTGRVRSGQKIAAKNHIIIMGDINPGAEIIAGGDILILGRLCGIARAGYPNNDKAIIFALDFRPTQIHIGGFIAAGLPPSSDNSSEFAHIENGSVIVENYMKNSLFGRLPWPEVR